MFTKANFKNKLLEDIKKHINKNYNNDIYKKALNIIIAYLKNENLLQNKKFIKLNYNFILEKVIQFLQKYNYDLESLINNSLENRNRKKVSSKIINIDLDKKQIIIDLSDIIKNNKISHFYFSKVNIYNTEIEEANYIDIDLKLKLELYSIENTN